MAKVLTKQELIKRRVNSGAGIKSGFYVGKAKAQLDAQTEVVRDSKGNPLSSVVVAKNEKWENSEGYAKLWNDIEVLQKKLKAQYNRRTNIATFPDDYYSLIDKIRIDITRRRMEEEDYTDMISTVIANDNFSKSVALDEFRPYGAIFREVTGAGDSTNLIDAKTGETESVTMSMFSVGWARTLEDELYNLDIHNLEKVNRAVTRGYTAKRNDLLIGQLVAKTSAAGWDSDQQVSADTGGATQEAKLYNTLNDAIDTLTGLKDPQTDQEIPTSQLMLACRPADVRRINRVLNGQLNVGGKGTPANFAALTEIVEILPYSGDVIYAGKDKETYAGIDSLKAYLFVPGRAGAPIWTLEKRGLTQEVGRAPILQLATEERVWYFVQAEYLSEFFGSSATGTSLGSGYGWVVEITLPAATS